MTREFAVAVAGGTVTAWQKGDGPHVLLLHGGPGVSDYTESLAAELEDGYTVTRYQQRGVAPSTAEGPFDVETHVADAIAVMDGAGIERAYLLGHSWGGHLAFHLALVHQDRFLGLVPIDPLGAIGDGGVGEMGAIMAERVGPEQEARAEELDARAMSPEGTHDDAVEAFTIMWPGYFASPDKVLPMPPPRISLRCNVETFESIEAHFEAETLARRLGEVQLPTVFVLGADSPLRPEYNITTAALLPNATYEIENTGHLVWMEKPGAVRRALDRLAALSRPSNLDKPRIATVADAATVAGLLDDFNVEFGEPSPGREVLARRLGRLLSTDTTLALLAGAPAAGFALLTLRSNVWYDDPVATLDELYVMPSERGRGIGSALLEASGALVLTSGVELMEISVDGEDRDARRFYERHGFTCVHGDHPEPDLYYSREFP